MGRVVLLHAGPTPWDLEDRVTGSHSLPLADSARAAVRQVVDAMTDAPTAIYRASDNEACDEVATIVAQKFSLKPRDHADLNALHLGLWQGLTRSELRTRFPSVFVQWEKNPMTVNPPDGESVPDAFSRLRGALAWIARRNRGGIVVIPLRPMVLQLAAGILRGETPEQAASHMGTVVAIETIELDDAMVKRLR